MTYYFTSITANYFAKARVLASTLKAHNLGAKFAIVLSDALPDFVDPKQELADEILFTSQMDIWGNQDSFFFKHNLTELCTAVKAGVARYILEKYSADSVVYLDQDIAVFDSLADLEAMFHEHSILLTPHQTEPEEYDFFIRRNEILFLKRGTYNFGFFGVKNDSEGLRFLDWWNRRLMDYCIDDNYEILPELEKGGALGLFTDQKWGDLIPCYFDRVGIIKEPGYNVCTWNLTHRHFAPAPGNKYTVNGEPLYFFHFSGFDSGGHINELHNIVDYYPANKDVEILSRWYRQMLKKAGQSVFEKITYSKTCYDNGVTIRDFERKLFHIRTDIHSIPEFSNPYHVTDGICFYSWVRQEYPKWFIQARKNDQLSTPLYSKAVDCILPKNSIRRARVRCLYQKLIRR
ncbi:MAG: hypothetical protein PHR27_10420 [Candidatus Cloacimonetes bacterium]|nr:hypothetical protein [Candidatus Cloacimonadota bacterium]